MAKQGGLGDQLFVGGYDLGDDIGSVGNISGGPAPLEVTGITKEAFQRIGGVRSGRMELSAFFNDAADQAHEVLSALPTADTLLTYMHGADIGDPAACLNAKQVNYDPTRAQDGGLLIGVEAQSNQYGLEWGVQLTAGKRTDTGATNGTALDLGADQPGNFDAQGYLQVLAFTGTDVTIKIQTSQDNGSTDPFADRITFTEITGGAPLTERKAMTSPGSQIMERYVRVVTATTGGFSNLVFAVVLNRNETAVAF